MLKSIVILFLMMPAALLAQVTVTGKVVSKVNGNGVPNASVFLSNASVGSSSSADGVFTLNNVRNGQYELVVTCVGYESTRQTIMVNGAALQLPDMLLIPKVTQLHEVKVNANRERYIRLFTQQFFGGSENAAECKLVNPEELDFQYTNETGRLRAMSEDFLIIENRALGYRIKYLLHSFDYDPGSGMLIYTGESVFEELTGTPKDEKRWQKKRVESFLGSDMHFLRACIANSIKEDKFTVRRLIRTPNKERPADSLIKAKLRFFRAQYAKTQQTTAIDDSVEHWRDKEKMAAYTQTLVRTPLDENEFIRRTEIKGIYAIGLKDCLQITYRNDDATVITFTQPYAFFDQNGIVHNPDSNMMEGHWAVMRIANLLPVDYTLPAKY